MEVLEYSVRHRRDTLKAMVLIDNSIGMGRPPVSSPGKPQRPLQPDEFRAYVKRFAAGMFKTPPPTGWLEAIEASATQLPPKAAWALLNKPYHRDFYKKAVLDAQLPLWYAVTPRFEAQSVELIQTQPRASATVFEQAGHALFVDSADRFNQSLQQFIERLR
jgi:microsomal epoxide hydrolase